MGGPDHPPHAHAQDDGPGGQQGGEHGVQVGGPQQFAGQDLDEARDSGQLGAPGLRVDLGAHGVLHPGVGGQDEEGREVGAGGHRPHAQVVEPWG